MAVISVNESKCSHCSICVMDCPMGLLALNQKKTPAFIEGLSDVCVACGHCMAVCPKGAISLNDIQPDKCMEAISQSDISFENVKKLLLSRRSIRNYKEKRVPNELLRQIIDIARYAPTGGNRQNVQWTVLDSTESVHTVAGLTIDYIKKLIQNEDPFAANYRLDRIVNDWQDGKDKIFREAPAVVLAHAPLAYKMAPVDCSIALTFLELAAFPAGLGTCWAGFFMKAVQEWEPLKEYLALPEANACFGAMMIGYPQYSYSRIPQRKDASIAWK